MTTEIQRMVLPRRQSQAMQLMRDDTSPLSIFLVKSGSAGESLLFRYPFEPLSLSEEQPGNSPKERDYPSLPYSSLSGEITDTNDHPHERHIVPDLFAIKEVDENDTQHSKVDPSPDNDPQIQTVVKLSNKVLSNIFAVKPFLCDQKFEVKINDVRFVGHPINLSGITRSAESKILGSRDVDRDLLTINIVFALKANASHDIVNCYHECSQRMSIGLMFEERRVAYLSEEARLMNSFHDEESGRCDFGEILKQSRLASTLTKVFEDLTDFGATHLTINRWMSISFCLPQKVHRLNLRHHEGLPSIGPQRIRKCLENLRPYHAVLLIVDVDTLQDSLPQDSSPAFFRVIRCISPVKNLLELSADADISLSQVFHVVAQLLYWGKATVIYPLCENNKYTVHPLAPTTLHSRLGLKFSQEFKGCNLIKVLSDFSFGITLKELQKTAVDKKRMVSKEV